MGKTLERTKSGGTVASTVREGETGADAPSSATGLDGGTARPVLRLAYWLVSGPADVPVGLDSGEGKYVADDRTGSS